MRFIWIQFVIIGLTFFSTYGKQCNIRSDFHNAEPNKKELESIMSDTCYVASNLTSAYKGLCHTMMADYVLLPTSKWQHFKTGQRLIEDAIKQDNKSIELRYIRLLVQLNAPKFLKYRKNINEDINLFIKHLPNISINKVWKDKFLENLIRSKYISEEQIYTLKQLKLEL